MPGEPFPLDRHPLTMSTLEIAGLTSKMHKHVLTDARKVLTTLGFQPAEFSARYKDAKGEEREVINLRKRECLILVSGYSIEMRARIIDRWMELEAALSGVARTTPIPPRPFDEWTPAELNSKVGAVAEYRMSIGPQAGQWAMQRLGFPMPPAHLMPRQYELDLKANP